MKTNRKRQLERHLRYMSIEVLNRKGIKKHPDYGKNAYYFLNQIKITRKKLKAYGN